MTAATTNCDERVLTINEARSRCARAFRELPTECAHTLKHPVLQAVSMYSRSQWCLQARNIMAAMCLEPANATQ
eukprot:CAMPEP_0172743250 /NCGR_PEP_ID=MMETSP1074-20121228/131754_1 /TAXON_ID=2916 /ORGANISM="Ceratium fusus, Strain PA161109" /LENGTH=73 /DNA_ID=CAMNT_0013573951 /DNA_START=188 /DNA_END=409 /DNA_ORIENTATION=+